jgi:hypothetical protein
MADFRKLAIDLIAADGKVDRAEIKVLKKALYADNLIDINEIQFLSELRAAVAQRASKKSTAAFDKFFIKALKDHILSDGIVTAEEVVLIQKHMMGDKKLSKEVKKLAKNLKKQATTAAPELDALLESLTNKKKKKKQPQSVAA